MKQRTLRPSPDALLDLKYDSSFKAMFTADTKDSNNALRDFISTVLNRQVESVTLMPNEPAIEILNQNQMSFDVSVKFNDGERVDLEMQCRNREYNYGARAEIQVARLLSSSNRKGDNWKTSPAYQISVLNFHYSNDDFSSLEHYTMRRDDGKQLAGKLNVIFIDLIKIRKLLGTPPENLTKLEKWGLFLSYASDSQQKEYIESLIKSEEGLMSAKSSLLTVSQDEINWAIENSIHTAICDYNTQQINLREKENAIREKENAVREKENAIQEKENAIQEKENAIQEKENAIQEKENAIQEKENAIQEKENAVREKENAIREKENAVHEKENTLRAREKALQEKEKRVLKQNMEKGRTEGEHKRAIETARAMLSDNMPVEQVAKWTQLSIEEIAQLQ